VRLERRRYERADGSSVIPVDALIERVCHTVSLGVGQLACRLALGAPSFSRAADNLQAAAQLTISPETLRQVVEQEGRLVVEQQNHGQLELDWTAADCQTARPDGGRVSRVYLSSDGVLLPMITRGEKRLRRQKIKERRKALGSSGLGRLPALGPGADQGFKEFKLVTLYDQEREHRVVMGTRGDHRQAGRMMRRMAGAVHLREAQESVAVIDGAEWIARQIDKNVPYLSGLTLDFYHLSQHVHQARMGLWGQESAEGKTWAGDLLHRARHEGYGPLWEDLVDLRAKTRGPARRGVIDDLMHYLAPRKEMVNYPQNQERGWDIGSGPMESMCKAMTRRLRGPGMRWDAHNAEAMMALEGLMQSQSWAGWWQKRVLSMN
jgi:hypothetical protein